MMPPVKDTDSTDFDSRLRRLAPWLLAVVALLILLPGNNLIPLIDRDEPRFARATVEMIERGEWVVPYFNNEYRFDKPILIYWMMRLCYALFGVNEFAARLPSVLSAILMAVIVWKMGERWFSARAGFFAAFGLLTGAQVLMHGRSAVADMPMVAMVALAQFALYELLYTESDRYPWKWFWTFYGALGLGFLAKGPVALAAPILTLPIQRLLWREPIPWRRLRILPGLVVVLAIMGSWGIPALVKTRGLFWSQGMETHVWERGFETFQGHGAFFLYYFATALISLFPWSAYFGDGIAVARRNWSRKNAFLVAWALGTYVLFSFYKTKLPHYVMPAFPALFLIIGQAADASYQPSRAATVWFRIMTGFALLVGVLGLVLSFVVRFPPVYAGLSRALLGGAILFIALAALGIFWRRRQIRWLTLPLVAVAISIALVGAGLRSASPAVKLTSVFSELPDNTVYGFHGFREPSLVFYAGHVWEPLDDNELQRFLDTPGPRILVLEESEKRAEDFVRPYFGKEPRSRDSSEKLDALKADGYETITVEGVNIARTSAVTLRVLVRR